MQIMTNHQQRGALRDYDSGIPIKVVCYTWRIGKTSLYRWLAARETKYRISSDALRNLRESQVYKVRPQKISL